MKVALWAENLAYPVSSMEDWAKLVDSQVAEAKMKGAQLFLMPEYSAAHWLAFIPRNLPGPEQLNRLAGYSAQAAALVSKIAVKHGLLVVSGSFPVHRPDLDPPLSNRAHIHFPDGKTLVQDKLCLTPFEKDKNDWNLSPGSELSLFEWQGYRIAVVICLDIELPALSARMASLDIDLILVPSMTSKLAGYHRVFSCAKARAVELLAAVAAVGVIGGAAGCEQHISGASFFLPCEEKFGHTGTLASVAPSYTAEGAGPLLIGDLSLDDIRMMRRGQAEVWPGAWKADHVAVTGD
ncbi:MAG: nitrilase [Alphaproteobacteria bacterium]|nr:nitrilase [Alphaproteobacteria bacterium]